MAGQSPLRQLFFYLRPYKTPLLLNIFSNIMMALCMVISIPIIIPFFQILFGRVKPSAQPVPFSINNIQSWLEYVFGNLVDTYSQEGALIIVCVTFVLIFLLKNIFRYLSVV
ncbi:MAG TPA: ABC transporter ATP-binding protein, partial [Saprospiraceae bacterium]|nr:ABC transporter ATP-binding protein [Saprospiraceae bacterium]